ncbi:putative 3-phosphoshikimate 1-carboxyvinyltransferase [Acetobacteraceae bacterium AT-5844]|nr:putative 3-phosphoshikimate 1-carboxyvinyltransferase [Acetobacteraceae bacterium AT-5844]
MSNPAAVEADTILGKLRASRPAQGLAGRIRLPGDTALGLRAMAIAALAVGSTDITGLPDGAPVQSMARALRQLGAGVEQLPQATHWRVQGRGIGGLQEPARPLDAGTFPLVAHLLSGVVAGHPLFATLCGGEAPLLPLTEALAAMGARIAGRRGRRPPLAFEGSAELLPFDISLAADPEGALTAALLLAGLCARGDSRLTGAIPAGMDTLLRHFGAVLRQEGRTLVLEGQPELQAAPLHLPADPLAAAAALVAGLLVPGSRIIVEDVAPDSPFLAALRALGAAPEAVAGHVTLEHGPLRGADLAEVHILQLHAEGPLLALAAAFAQGSTRLRGAAGWGESRLEALIRLLNANGAKTLREGNDLILTGDGRPLPGGGHLPTQEEPCIAMSAIVLGLAADTAVTLEDTRPLDTALPGGLQALTAAAGATALVRA